MKLHEYIKNHSPYKEPVWIVDYRFNNRFIEKPIRHVPPTKVAFRPNSEVTKKVYYSDRHFRPYGKDGKLLKKVIAPFDNTGFRSYTGVAVQVFLTEAEAHEYYKQVKREILVKAERELNEVSKQYKNLFEGLEK